MIKKSEPHFFDFDNDLSKNNSIIKVIGVGGGGSNAVTNMFKNGIKDVTFVICNTDEQALRHSPVPNQLQIGVNLTLGLGAGANPEVGKSAAVESKEEIESLLNDGTKMLFITAGMGGGTGTGAAPVIANIANKLGILTVGIVTMPFSFEGKKKFIQAQNGIQELKQYCDTVLVILNDKLKEVLGNVTISNAFSQADNILTTAVKSIAEIITVPGYVNVDFEDVKTVIKNAGAAVMGSAQVEGEDRAKKAVEKALISPLLNHKNIKGAKKILLSIYSSPDMELQMDELTEITNYIREIIGEDTEMIFGNGIDEQLNKSIKITIIATGFDDSEYNDLSNEQNRDKKLETAQKIVTLDRNESKKEYINDNIFVDYNKNSNSKYINNFENIENKQYTNDSIKMINIKDIDSSKLIVHSLVLEDELLK